MDPLKDNKIHMKGAAWLDTIAATNSLCDAQGIEKTKAALNDQDREALFGKKILPISWVDFTAVLNFIGMLDLQLGKGDGQLVADISSHMAVNEFKGFYKLFMKLSSPEFVLNNAPRIFRQQFDRGQVMVQWPERGHGILVFHDFEVTASHHEKMFMAFHRQALTLSGAKNIKGIHSKCINRGDEHCEYDYHWD